jgi:uncharacterized protein (DUF433 family)
VVDTNVFVAALLHGATPRRVYEAFLLMDEGRITINAAACVGKPCIRGTRIPVYDDIKACIHYAAAILKNEEVSIQELA